MEKGKDTSIDKIIDNLFFINPSFTKSLRRSFRAKSNLNPGSFYILRVLERYDVLSMSAIGYKLQMPKPHVTAQVDKLIAEKMVERLFYLHDRRIVNIKLTEKGRADLKMILHEVSQEMRLRIQTLDKQRLKTMLESSQQLRDILSEIMKDPFAENVSEDKQ